MRNLQITVFARPNTNDNTFSFLSNSATANPGQEDQTYAFISAMLNYSVQGSSVTSTVIFSMNTPLSGTNVIRSGQPIKIMDGADEIFEGQIIPKYQSLPISDNGRGGLYLIATLIPSIFQLTVTPMVFDSNQAQQINSLLGIDLATILAGNVAQQVATSDLLSYIVTNTDYKNIFQKTISPQNLPASVFLMATAGQSRDMVLRASIDFTNTVLYQQEDGNIIIRQLDSGIKTPFSLDLANANSGEVNNGEPKISILEYSYQDNAVLCPGVVSNYALLPANQSIAADVSVLLVSYKPSATFYPRIQQLQNTGWFVGSIVNSQINQNIVSDPTVAAILQGYQSYPDQYMTSSAQFGAKEDFIAAYQALLTGKQLGQALTGYANLECLISLDDPYLPTAGMGNILGSCVTIQNCDLGEGLIATYSRSYSAEGSYMSLNIVPLGSITGYWLR